jgi:2-polyprenyl-6-methoxyphenol hydroxylase-like FAD-dependent oxidoreductase
MNTKAIVIGGGVAGPVAAIALRRVGWDVTVYEAYADPAGDVGSYVSLGANGLRALEAVGARAAVVAAGTEIPLLRLWSGRGKLLGEAPRGRVTLMRGHLVEALREEARATGAELLTGYRLQTVRDGAALLTAPGGGTVRVAADLVVGADGIHSTLRRVIDPEAPQPEYAGLWSIGGRSLHRVAPGAFNLMFGSKATFVHAATGHGTLWTAQVPTRTQPAAPLDRDGLLALFATDHGPARAIIEATDAWHPFTAMRHLPAPPRTARDTLVLIGDAAHPIGAGQGASLAIEDAVLLAKCLRDHPSPTAAVSAFETLRQPRTARMLKAAGANLDAKVAGPLAARARDIMMPFFFKRFAEKGSAWMYDYDIDWNTPLTPTAA